MSQGRLQRPRHVRNHRRSPHGRAPRRLLLLLLLFALALFLLALGVLLAGRAVREDVSGKSVVTDSVDTGPAPRLRVSSGNGEVRVEGIEDLRAIELEATTHALGPNREEARRRAADTLATLSRDGDTFAVETGGGRNTGTDLALRVPQNGSLEIESAAGDVQVLGLSGDIVARAAAGDVTVENAGGSVEVRASRGDVVVSGVNTDTGQVAVSVDVGDASMENLVVGTLDAHVETGDLILAGRFSGSGEALVRTGDVIVRLPPEDTRELDLRSRIGDVVRNTGESAERNGEE